VIVRAATSSRLFPSTLIRANCDDSAEKLVVRTEIHVQGHSVKLMRDMSNKTMHCTASVWQVQLRILLCASVVVIEFVTALSAPNVDYHVAQREDESDVIGKDYNLDVSKYFVSENETYASDKRIIVEEYFRQSALAPKNSPNSYVPTETPYANIVNASMSSTNVNQEDNESDEVSGKRGKHSVTDEGNMALTQQPSGASDS